jgi:hypothetical protein
MSHPFDQQPALRRRQKQNPNTLNLNPMNLILNFVWNFLRPKLVNFKTSIAGVGLILVGLNTGWKELEALVNGGVPDMELLTLSGGNLLAGWGLLTARDADKTTLESIGQEQLNKHGLEVKR